MIIGNNTQLSKAASRRDAQLGRKCDVPLFPASRSGCNYLIKGCKPTACKVEGMYAFSTELCISTRCGFAQLDIVSDNH